MFRILLTYIVPLVAPTLLYMAYVAYARKRAQRAGAEEVPGLERGPFFWSLVMGFALLIISLVGLAMTTGVDPGDGGYTSPRFEDGKLVPPTFK